MNGNRATLVHRFLHGITRFVPTFIYALLALAIAAWMAMLAVHVAALIGVVHPFERFLKVLVPGMFVFFVPAILVMNWLTRDFKQKELWRAALRGCPRWMRLAIWIIFAYAWIGFFGFTFLYGGARESHVNNIRGLSAILLTFYSIPVAILYSATRFRRFDESRRCLNGHRIGPLAKFCEECGGPAALPR